jgi:hypothetical protein
MAPTLNRLKYCKPSAKYVPGSAGIFNIVQKKSRYWFNWKCRTSVGYAVYQK